MVEYELQGHIAVITINRPEARNAVNGAVATGIEEAIDKLEADANAWIGILTGARTEKGYIFCAGADLKEINSGNAGGLQTRRGGFGGITQRERAKPIIAAVDGPALAGGTERVAYRIAWSLPSSVTDNTLQSSSAVADLQWEAQ